MPKKDVYYVGDISFTKEGYEEFTAKNKEEQTEIVYNSISPKDYNRAAVILKKVPHGNSSKGVSETTTTDNTSSTTTGSSESSSAGRGSKNKETKDQ